jgi:uncharacterized protein YbaR (Trm112 family)
MRVDLIELLRCPAPHESSPLVTVANARDGDRLLDATLGCPVCGAEYAMREGVVYLADVTPGAIKSFGEGDAMRLAALLDLTAPGARVALGGGMASAAEHLETLTGARCVAINAALSADATVDQIVIDTARRLPFEPGNLAGLAVDPGTVDLLADASRVVRRGGRVVAPASAPIPAGCRELARDDREWVAAVDAGPGDRLVSLRRAGEA